MQFDKIKSLGNVEPLNAVIQSTIGLSEIKASIMLYWHFTILLFLGACYLYNHDLYLYACASASLALLLYLYVRSLKNAYYDAHLLVMKELLKRDEQIINYIEDIESTAENMKFDIDDLLREVDPVDLITGRPRSYRSFDKHEES